MDGLRIKARVELKRPHKGEGFPYGLFAGDQGPVYKFQIDHPDAAWPEPTFNAVGVIETWFYEEGSLFAVIYLRNPDSVKYVRPGGTFDIWYSGTVGTARVEEVLPMDEASVQFAYQQMRRLLPLDLGTAISPFQSNLGFACIGLNIPVHIEDGELWFARDGLSKLAPRLGGPGTMLRVSVGALDGVRIQRLQTRSLTLNAPASYTDALAALLDERLAPWMSVDIPASNP